MTALVFKRIGITYSSGQRTRVEVGMSGQSIGNTAHDTSTGKQTFWFKSIEDFHKHAKNIWECLGRHTQNVPVPVIQFEEGFVVQTTLEEALEPLQNRIAELEKGKAPKAPLSYKESLKRQQAENAESLKRLNTFMGAEGFMRLSDEQRTLLTEQSQIMAQLDAILEKRIALIKDPEPAKAIDISAIVGERKIRLNALATETGIPEVELRKLIEADPNMAKVDRGWVKRKDPVAVETKEPAVQGEPTEETANEGEAGESTESAASTTETEEATATAVA